MKSVKNFCTNQVVKYLFWGAMTTVVYFLVRLFVIAITSGPMIPVAFAEIISIIFAFVVNKFLVFNKEKQHKNNKIQLVIFLIGRAIAAGIDFLFTFLMIKKFYEVSINILDLNTIDTWSIFHFSFLNSILGTPYLLNEIIWTILIQIIIIVVNYVVSKYFVFD